MSLSAIRVRLRGENEQGDAVPREDVPLVLEALTAGGDHEALRAASRRLRLRDRIAAAAAVSVFADLLMQQWKINVTEDGFDVTPPSPDPLPGEDAHAAKSRIRANLDARCVDELNSGPVQGFLRGLEQRRAHDGRRCSVLDLIDDGAELADTLAGIARLPPEEREQATAEVIQPQLEIVDPERTCVETGLLLTDVWRYFRHTWALPLYSVPGRTMAYLVRNRARRGRPVMGIGALSSPVPQLTLREEWIGWTGRHLARSLREHPDQWGAGTAALSRVVEQALADVRADDLLCAGEDLDDATVLAAVVERLELVRKRADDERAAALAKAQGRPAKEVREDFASESSTPLFVRKRAKLVSELLRARRALARAPAPAHDLADALEHDSDLEWAVRIALRELRKIGLASRVLDLNVCGAVAPYGGLLAGKLVALAATSAEIAAAYQGRYSQTPGIIASKLAGRPVFRSADLCVVTTTSIYGVASSQYNRLRVDVPVGREVRRIEFEEIGKTEGISPLHLSRETVDLLAKTSRRNSAAGQFDDVNFIFGEGTSPKLRRARRGLAALFSPVQALLAHGSYRRMYAVETVPGARAALLTNRVETTPRAPFAAISQAWSRRWLVQRLVAGDCLSRVRREGPESVARRLAPADRGQLNLFGAR